MGLFGLFKRKSAIAEAGVPRSYEPIPSAFAQNNLEQPSVNQDLNPFTQPTAFQQGYNKDSDLIVSKLELINARLENIAKRLETIERYLMQQNPPQDQPQAQMQRRW